MKRSQKILYRIACILPVLAAVLAAAYVIFLTYGIVVILAALAQTELELGLMEWLLLSIDFLTAIPVLVGSILLLKGKWWGSFFGMAYGIAALLLVATGNAGFVFEAFIMYLGIGMLVYHGLMALLCRKLYPVRRQEPLPVQSELPENN